MPATGRCFTPLPFKFGFGGLETLEFDDLPELTRLNTRLCLWLRKEDKVKATRKTYTLGEVQEGWAQASKSFPH